MYFEVCVLLLSLQVRSCRARGRNSVIAGSRSAHCLLTLYRSERLWSWLGSNALLQYKNCDKKGGEWRGGGFLNSLDTQDTATETESELATFLRAPKIPLHKTLVGFFLVARVRLASEGQGCSGCINSHRSLCLLQQEAKR